MSDSVAKSNWSTVWSCLGPARKIGPISLSWPLEIAANNPCKDFVNGFRLHVEETEYNDFIVADVVSKGWTDNDDPFEYWLEKTRLTIRVLYSHFRIKAASAIKKEQRGKRFSSPVTQPACGKYIGCWTGIITRRSATTRTSLRRLGIQFSLYEFQQN